VLACENAVGQEMPPMVIFDGKNHNYLWMIGEVPGMFYGMSNKGWMDQEFFQCWLKKNFLKYAVGSQPLLLLFNRHSSHYELRVWKGGSDYLLSTSPYNTGLTVSGMHSFRAIETSLD